MALIANPTYKGISVNGAYWRCENIYINQTYQASADMPQFMSDHTKEDGTIGKKVVVMAVFRCYANEANSKDLLCREQYQIDEKRIRVVDDEDIDLGQNMFQIAYNFALSEGQFLEGGTPA